ncbi:MAG: hypothetical protein C5B59_17285 [Bacteroidetes bacterium]|nr:MAG: hypothetical protein C5B59_17285 [Bacteroidota bacterium]
MLSGIPVNQGVASAGTGSHTHTLPNAVKQGDVVVVASTATGYTGVITGIVDPAGNTYLKILSGTGGTNPCLEVYRCISKADMAAGSVLTISYAVTTLLHCTAIVSIPGMSAAPDDVELIFSSSVNSQTPFLGSGTLNDTEELVLGFYTSHAASGTVTPNAGFTTAVTGTYNNGNETLQIDYQRVSSTASVGYNPTTSAVILCRIGVYSLQAATPQRDLYPDGSFPRRDPFRAGSQWQYMHPGIAPTPVFVPIFPPPIYPDRLNPPPRFLTANQWQDRMEETPIPNAPAPTADFMAFFDMPPKTRLPNLWQRVFYDTSSENDFNLPLPPAPTNDWRSFFPDIVYPRPIPPRWNREYHDDPLVPSNTPGPIFQLGFYFNVGTVSSTSRACTTLYDMFPGDSIIVIAGSAAGNCNVNGVTDTAGNTYILDDAGSSAAGAPEDGVLHCVVTSFLPKGSTITATFNGTNQNHTIMAIGISGSAYDLVSTNYIDANPTSNSGSGATSSTSLSSGTFKENVEFVIFDIETTSATATSLTITAAGSTQFANISRSSALEMWIAWEVINGTSAISMSASWTTAAAYRQHIRSYRLVPKVDAWGVFPFQDYTVRRPPDIVRDGPYWFEVIPQTVPIPILALSEYQANPPRRPPNLDHQQYFFESWPPPFSTGVGPPLGTDPCYPYSMWRLMHPARVRWACWYPIAGWDEVLPLPTPQSVATEIDYSWYMARFYPKTRMPYPWFLDWESREVLPQPNSPFNPSTFDYQMWRRNMTRS